MRAARASMGVAPMSWGAKPGHTGRSQGAARMEVHHAANADPVREASPARLKTNRASVQGALKSQGQSLREMGGVTMGIESRFGFDLSRVRIHTGAEAADSASRLNAEAYTAGSHIVFGEGRFDPYSANGRSLLAHELQHVIQQGAQEDVSGADMRGLDSPANCALEVDAERAERNDLEMAGAHDQEPGTIQRKVSMRDVGRGDQSGFGRVPELIDRLNALSKGLTFALNGNDLTYTVKSGGTLSSFDTQMQGFIDQEAVIPLRFTNRHGLLGTPAAGYHDRVMEDAWSSGYVDIDDLLASNDLGIQSVLVHFLRERGATQNYAHRMGSESLETDPAVSPQAAAHQAEFNRAHAKGIDAELSVLRGFFNDPSIRLVDHDSGDNVLRRYRNNRHDAIHTRLRPGQGKDAGVDAIIVEVITRDGRVHTPEEYRDMLAAEAAALGAPTRIGGTAPFFGTHFGHGPTIPP